VRRRAVMRKSLLVFWYYLLLDLHDIVVREHNRVTLRLMECGMYHEVTR
jgi:hypothetical protein